MFDKDSKIRAIWFVKSRNHIIIHWNIVRVSLKNLDLIRIYNIENGDFLNFVSKIS